MDSELLRAFVTVAECEGFSAAARILSRTQSTVSLQIKRLEDVMGERVFERNSRNVALTSAGGRLLPYARRILRLHAEARTAMEDDRRGEVIRLGLSDEHATAHLPALLPRFAELHPEARLSIVCDISTELVRQFQDGLLDLVLAIRHHPTPTGRLLGREHLVWVVEKTRSISDWPVLPLALNPEGCIFRAHAYAALGRHDRRWDVRYTSKSPTGVNVAVQSGLALTVKTRRSLPAGCRIVGSEEGLPELGSVEIELHSAPGQASDAFTALSGSLERLAGRLLSATTPQLEAATGG